MGASQAKVTIKITEKHLHTWERT